MAKLKSYLLQALSEDLSQMQKLKGQPVLVGASTATTIAGLTASVTASAQAMS